MPKCIHFNKIFAISGPRRALISLEAFSMLALDSLKPGTGPLWLKKAPGLGWALMAVMNPLYPEIDPSSLISTAHSLGGQLLV